MELKLQNWGKSSSFFIYNVFPCQLYAIPKEIHDINFTKPAHKNNIEEYRELRNSNSEEESREWYT